MYRRFVALGKYPPPSGASEIIGLEVSGVVAEIGSNVKTFGVGDRVMALLSGGGYSDQVLIEEDLCLPIPTQLTLEQVNDFYRMTDFCRMTDFYRMA